MQLNKITQITNNSKLNFDIEKILLLHLLNLITISIHGWRRDMKRQICASTDALEAYQEQHI